MTLLKGVHAQSLADARGHHIDALKHALAENATVLRDVSEYLLAKGAGHGQLAKDVRAAIAKAERLL